jgi:hypothetical protein
MATTITNPGRSGNADLVSGNIRLNGPFTTDDSTKKVKTFNLAVLVNQPITANGVTKDNFIQAGNATLNDNFNIGLSANTNVNGTEIDFRPYLFEANAAVNALISDIESQYA